MVYLVFLMQIALIVFLYLLWSQAKEAKTAPPPSPESGHRLLQAIEEVGAQMVESLEEKAGELRRLIELADHRVQLLTELRATIRLEQNPPAAPAKKTPVARAIPDQYQRVLELAQQGKTVYEIAQKTHMPKGEIQFLLGLQRSQKESALQKAKARVPG